MGLVVGRCCGGLWGLVVPVDSANRGVWVSQEVGIRRGECLLTPGDCRRRRSLEGNMLVLLVSFNATGGEMVRRKIVSLLENANRGQEAIRCAEGGCTAEVRATVSGTRWG